MVLIPAYGRDYKSAAAVKADFESGKDFLIADWDHHYSGKPVGKSGLVSSGVASVEIRYAAKRKVVVIKL